MYLWGSKENFSESILKSGNNRKYIELNSKGSLPQRHTPQTMHCIALGKFGPSCGRKLLHFDSDFYRTQVYLGSLTEWRFASYTSYTSYTSYRLYTEKVTRVAPSGGQFCNLCKWLNLVVKFVTNASGAICWPKFATNASGAIWWPNLELMQVAPSGGQFCN